MGLAESIGSTTNIRCLKTCMLCIWNIGEPCSSICDDFSSRAKRSQSGMESGTRRSQTDLLTNASTAERAGFDYFVGCLPASWKKTKTFSFLRFSCCYGHIAYNKLFSSKFDIWAHRSGFGEIPWTPSAHKLDHCTYLCTGRDSWSFARDTIILARHRHPHHHLVNIKQIWGAVFIILFIISLVASLFRRWRWAGDNGKKDTERREESEQSKTRTRSVEQKN